MLGNSAGGFTFGPGYAGRLGMHPAAIVTTDFNRDGIPDLAVTSWGDTAHNGQTMAILLGDGRGGFKAAPDSPWNVGQIANSIALGDFNGDGFQDIAVASAVQNNLTVLLGDGTGSFKTTLPFDAGPDRLRSRWVISLATERMILPSPIT